MASRREFLQPSAAHAATGLVLGTAGGPAAAERVGAAEPRSFVDVRRPPDFVAVETAAGVEPLARAGDGAGDDTSGREWARTRKMGVNTLAFRAVPHGAFYVVDADCVGVTAAIPWALNRQWLDLPARSGTPLFVSLAPDALGAEQRGALRAALARAAAPQPLGEPLDWQGTTVPARWRLGGEDRRYAWMDDDGAPLGV